MLKNISHPYRYTDLTRGLAWLTMNRRHCADDLPIAGQTYQDLGELDDLFLLCVCARL